MPWLSVPHRAPVTPIELCAAFALALGCDTNHAPMERQLPPGAGQVFQERLSGIKAGPEVGREPFKNPYEGNKHALRDGSRLYTWFNCQDCHGAIGGGGMGPPLRDQKWIYGGRSEQIYLSIMEGRPQGMPSYSGTLSEDAAWRLVAFVQALGETSSPLQTAEVASEPEKTPGTQEQEEQRHEKKE